MVRPLSLALQEVLVDWSQSDWPIPWEQVFGREAALALELGFGNGSFLTEQAARHPERDHVGVELSWTAATHLFRRVHKAGVTNVRALLGDAEALVLHHFAPDSLSEVFVNHPCPWPKERHARRRLLHHRFLELLAERMRPGARLTIVTDHAPHATWLATELAQQSALESCGATIESREPEGRSPTKYQRKAMAQGVPIHYFEWRKRADSPPSTAARAHSSAAAMPNLKLRGDVPAAELFRGFEPQSFREQARGVEVVIKLQGVYRQLDAPAWLLEAFVQEDHLRQEFGIAVIAREDSLLVKPSMIGAPHPTRGVKRAIWCVGRWLVERHPLLAVQSSSLGDDLSLPGAARPPG